MAKVIETKELKERNQNLAALLILIEQYVKAERHRVIEKVKQEQ